MHHIWLINWPGLNVVSTMGRGRSILYPRCSFVVDANLCRLFVFLPRVQYRGEIVFCRRRCDAHHIPRVSCVRVHTLLIVGSLPRMCHAYHHRSQLLFLGRGRCAACTINQGHDFRGSIFGHVGSCISVDASDLESPEGRFFLLSCRKGLCSAR